MLWGKDLWDQFDQIASYTSKGIEFCDKFAQFTKTRASIEIEYASKLKKLVKDYQPKKKDDDVEWTTIKAFNCMLAEVFDMAGQHEMLADSLTNNVQKELIALVQQTKQERKKHLISGNKQALSLQHQIQQLDKCKNKYEKAFKEMEKAQEAYRKADADKHMSRADVEKAQINMQQKQQICRDHRNDYASELAKTNQFQQQHYHTHMPAIFDLLEEMEQKRTERVQEMMRGCADVEKSILPIINSCISGIDRAADTISFNEDVKMAVDKMKTGFNPPEDLPFEDLSNPSEATDSISPTSSKRFSRTDLQSRNSFTVGSIKTKKKTKLLNLFTGSKVDESKEDFSHLPPNQQRKKLHQKIEHLRSSLAKETAERDGMLKMQDVYKQNNALGDPGSLAKQLEENGVKLDRLRLELQKFENYMSEAENATLNKSKQGASPSPLTTINDKINYRSSILQVENKSSDNNVSLTGSYNTNNDNSHSYLGGNNDNLFVNNKNNEIEEGNTESLGPICYALFPFTAVSEGSISMVEGEEFEVLESDQGDGWVQVRRLSNQEEGFVPASYIRMSHDKDFDDYDEESITS